MTQTNPKILLAEALEDFRRGVAGRVLDRGIAVDERQAQPLRQALADSRFTRAHQSDQHNRPIEALRQLFHKPGLYIGLSGRAKGPPQRIHGKNMSRATLFLILLALLIVGGAVFLSMNAHEVPAKPIEVDVQS